MADTSAMLSRLAWCCVKAARVAPPHTPTRDWKNVKLLINSTSKAEEGAQEAQLCLSSVSKKTINSREGYMITTLVLGSLTATVLAAVLASLIAAVLGTINFDAIHIMLLSDNFWQFIQHVSISDDVVDDESSDKFDQSLVYNISSSWGIIQ